MAAGPNATVRIDSHLLLGIPIGDPLPPSFQEPDLTLYLFEVLQKARAEIIGQ